MSDDKKSTDPGLSAAERKTLRGHEAQEAICDHEAAQKAFHENRERLRGERMVREAAEGPMVAPTPERCRTIRRSNAYYLRLGSRTLSKQPT
jgi:hypothetical protein